MVQNPGHDYPSDDWEQDFIQQKKRHQRHLRRLRTSTRAFDGFVASGHFRRSDTISHVAALAASYDENETPRTLEKPPSRFLALESKSASPASDRILRPFPRHSSNSCQDFNIIFKRADHEASTLTSRTLIVRPLPQQPHIRQDAECNDFRRGRGEWRQQRSQPRT